MREVSPQQRKAAVMLVSGVLCKDVAQTLGLSAQTISAWRAEPNFQCVLQHEQQILLSQTRDQARALVVEALAEVRLLMKESKSDSIRLRAALEILKGTGIVGHTPQNHRIWRSIDQA